MPIDGLAEETSKLAINNESQHDNPDITHALSRLRYEANQAMAYNKKSLRDVTKEFREASEQLLPGQLVKDDYFTLFEAVGALEVGGTSYFICLCCHFLKALQTTIPAGIRNVPLIIVLQIGDPKMDSGYVPVVCPDTLRGIFQISARIIDRAQDDTFEPEFDPCSALDAAHVIWIIDKLLCLEITWLDGYPLSQTIYTSLHIDRLLSPDKVHKDSFYTGRDIPTSHTGDHALVHNLLRAYCIALIKCCQLALHLIQSQNFYEEEDFVTHLFGRELLPETGSLAAENLLVNAIDGISALSIPEESQNALTTRCQFRLSLLRNLSDDVKNWNELKGHLQSINSSHALGKPCSAAFSEKVQRKLATSTPPRPMIEIPFEDAYTRWAKLCNDMLAAYRFTSAPIVQSPYCLQRAVWAFAYQGKPCTLARAQMQSILFSDQAVAGQVYHYDLLLNDMSELLLAGDPLVDPASFNVEVTSDPRHICSKILQDFMEKAVEEYLNLYRMVCQNRCRIRRTFTQAIPVLDALEQAAETVDKELKQNSASLRRKAKNPKTSHLEELDPLQSWCYFHTLRILAWTIQLGFETEIYLPDELGRMYHFLSILCIFRSNLINQMIRFVVERRKTLRDDPARLAECSATHDFLICLNDLAQLTHVVAEALFRFYCLLRRLKIISPPERDFAHPELLHELRMKPFNSVRGDDIPDNEIFQEDEEEQDKMPFAAVIESINEDIKYAKTLLADLKTYTPEQAKYVGTEEEWKKEIKQTETTCVAIAVAVSQLKRIREKHGDDDLRGLVDCKYEKKYHEWWVIPQLKERVRK